MILLITFALSFYGLGLIWAIETLIFPGWALLPDLPTFEKVRGAHWKIIPYLVFIPIGLLFVLTIALLWYMPLLPIILAFFFQLFSHILTGLTFGRWQARIAIEHQGPNSPFLKKILATHWIRTTLVTLNAAALLWAVLIVFT